MPQFPKLVDKAPTGPEWIHEIKFDGYRVQLHVVRKRVTIRTRRGHDWTDKFPALVKAAAKLPNCIIDAELCAVDRRGASDFPALLAALHTRSSHLVLFCFDMPWGPRGDLREHPLLDRKAALAAALEKAGSPLLRYSAHFEDDGVAIARAACAQQLEGIVSKLVDASYRSGKGESWLKTKCRPGIELVIGGWAEKGASFPSLLVGAYDGGKARLRRQGWHGLQRARPRRPVP